MNKFITNMRKKIQNLVTKKPQIIHPSHKFFRKQVTGSFLLLAAASIAIIWANSSFTSYQHFWQVNISFSLGDFKITKSFVHWINEALMTFFFITVGLEIKREILVGEIASFKKAFIPVSAAIGGMLIPALIYTIFNYNTDAMTGWAIPVATDIAFSLAAIAVLGKRIPFGVRIFLTAFAIADDLGAVLVIAIFYTQNIVFNYLIIAGIFILLLALANYMNIRWPILYALIGIGLWLAVLGSGIHATIAGVIIAMFVPAKAKYDTVTFKNHVRDSLNRLECGDGNSETVLVNRDHEKAIHNIVHACHEVETPLQRIGHNLHPWITFLILPVFALANTGICLYDMNLSQAFLHPVTLGISLGLILGKPLGILLFTYLAIVLLKTELLAGVRWSHIIGASILGGIGFTMSLFITGLSFPAGAYTEYSKLGIISASIISALAGVVLLSRMHKKKVVQ